MSTGLHELAEFPRIPTRLLVDEYLSLAVGLARNTIAQRRSQTQNWALPQWDDWAVSGVTKHAVEQWIEEMHRQAPTARLPASVISFSSA